MNLCKLLSKNRSYIMGLAMISIMLFHQTWVKDLPFLGFRFVGHYGVDLFFFVIVFRIYYSLHNSKDSKGWCLNFYKRRLRRLIPLCLFIGFAKFLIVKGWTETTYGMHADWKTITSMDMWYIQAILVFYFLSPLFYNVINRYGKIFIIPILLISIFGVFLRPFTDPFDWSIVRLATYFGGMLIASQKINLSKNFLRVGILFVITAIAYRALAFFKILPVIELYNFIILAFGIPSLCYYLSLIRPLFQKIKIDGAISFMGKHSLEIYLWHGFVYKCVSNWLDEYQALVVGVTISILVAYLSYACVELLPKKI